MKTVTQFETIEGLMKALNSLAKEGKTYVDYLELRDYVITCEGDIKALMNKATKAEISKYYRGFTEEKKDRMVKNFYQALCGRLVICEDAIVYSDDITHMDACKALYAKIDEQIFNTWQAGCIAEAAAFQKCLSNPETLAEFETFVRYRGMGALSSDQLAAYDDLRTGKGREAKMRELERKAQLSAVNLEGLEFSLHNSFHAKKQIPLWVVQLNGRVERDVYNDLNEKARALGGYYSSYRGNGAIPGFTFDKEENAKAFMRLQTESVDASEIQKQKIADRVQHRAETLQDKGERLEDSATEDLTRDRKDNTARRARMAASAERQAMNEIEFAKTMQLISDGLKAGTVKYLDRLQNYTELDELYGILNRAKWEYTKEQKMTMQEREAFELIPAVADYAKFPYPSAHIDNMTRVIPKLAAEKGKKLAANRIIKLVKLWQQKLPNEPIVLFRGSRADDYKTVFCSFTRAVDRYELERFKHQYDRYKRMLRLGIDQPHELRATLRELIAIRAQAVMDPEVKRAQEIRELERKFLNKDVPGFFPTPEGLALEIAEKAQIEPGHKVLEPSAGLGHLATAIYDACPDCDLDLIEIQPDLCEALRLKGFEKVQNVDFIQLSNETSFSNLDSSALYDRIVMNPPFENLQDIDHVLNAWNFLKPGGRLVAIMAANKFGNRGKVQEFMDFANEYGIMTDNEPGAFLSAFRPTSVNTVTVVLDKPL